MQDAKQMHNSAIKERKTVSQALVNCSLLSCMLLAMGGSSAIQFQSNPTKFRNNCVIITQRFLARSGIERKPQLRSFDYTALATDCILIIINITICIIRIEL